MPDDAPGSLAAESYADVIGFLLEKNGAPAGVATLPVDPDILTRTIVFTEKPGR